MQNNFFKICIKNEITSYKKNHASIKTLQTKSRQYKDTSNKITPVQRHFKQNYASTKTLQTKSRQYKDTSNKITPVQRHFKQNHASTKTLQTKCCIFGIF